MCVIWKQCWWNCKQISNFLLPVYFRIKEPASLCFAQLVISTLWCFPVSLISWFLYCSFISFLLLSMFFLFILCMLFLFVGIDFIHTFTDYLVGSLEEGRWGKYCRCLSFSLYSEINIKVLKISSMLINAFCSWMWHKETLKVRSINIMKCWI